MKEFMQFVKFAVSVGTFIILVVNYIHTSKDRSRIEKRRNLLYATIDDLYNYLDSITKFDKKKVQRELIKYDSTDYAIRKPTGYIPGTMDADYEVVGHMQAVDTDKLANKLLEMVSVIRANRNEEIGIYLIQELESRLVEIRNPGKYISKGIEGPLPWDEQEIVKMFPQAIGQVMDEMMKRLYPYVQRPKHRPME